MKHEKQLETQNAAVQVVSGLSRLYLNYCVPALLCHCSIVSLLYLKYCVPALLCPCSTWNTVSLLYLDYCVCGCVRDAAHLLLAVKVAVKVAARAMPDSLFFRPVGESTLPVLRELECGLNALG